MELAASVLLDTILITLTLALAAFGLAIIYGLIGVINMGHGAMLTWARISHGQSPVRNPICAECNFQVDSLLVSLDCCLNIG